MTYPTPNNQDELFELCREVYERTGWKYTIGRFHDDGSYDGYVGHRGIAYTPSPEDSQWLKNDVPLYTSDYLLERLPPVILEDTSDSKNVPMILTLWINGDKTAHAAYLIPFDEQNRGSYAQTADMPLKALLKLTIALHDAGVKL